MVYVFVPPDIEEIESYVARALEGSAARPEIVYPSFERPCSCIGREAASAGYAAVDATERGKQWLEELRLARTNTDQETEQRILEQRFKLAMERKRAHPLWCLPDPECDTCEGGGTYTDTYDPNGCCDYWTVGGSYADRFPLDRVMLRELTPEERHPAVLVTPDGYWHESVSYAFLPDPETPELKASWQRWEAAFQALFEAHLNCLAVVLDCHI
ncbi:hypothetical protein [Armatimonas sp.]|uniref:hypothetical protein n=1 Tax=Armatimonas sp. TaxID=1872638 RepID=UPI00374CDDFD